MSGVREAATTPEGSAHRGPTAPEPSGVAAARFPAAAEEASANFGSVGTAATPSGPAHRGPTTPGPLDVAAVGSLDAAEEARASNGGSEEAGAAGATLGVSEKAGAAIAAEESVVAHNYHPLPIVVASAEGAWVTDVAGKRYLDCLAAYSAVNFGHSNPVLLDAARAQLERVTLTSRAFHNDQLGPFAQALAELCGKNMVLPMNTGAEAVESAIKVARAWGYRVKGVARDSANIIVMAGNFHGRTTTIISFSDDDDARADFGPYTPGFRTVPYGDAEALEAAIDENTVAVLVEPIQGESGVLVPPTGYLPAVRALCTAHHVLFIADEIQSGLGRTGTTFACELVGVVPDLYLLGKALGGGIVPVSAVVGNDDILGVLQPGQHGSTFGGNPLASAVGHAVVRMLASGEYQKRARVLGARMHEKLGAFVGSGVLDVHGAGLWAGVDIDPALATGREVCERLMERGILAKDTHGSTIRFAPPIVIDEADLDWMIAQFGEVLQDLQN